VTGRCRQVPCHELPALDKEWNLCGSLFATGDASLTFTAESSSPRNQPSLLSPHLYGLYHFLATLYYLRGMPCKSVVPPSLNRIPWSCYS
jgi:hypothetical protein